MPMYTHENHSKIQLSKFGNWTSFPSLCSWNIAECDVKPQSTTTKIQLDVNYDFFLLSIQIRSTFWIHFIKNWEKKDIHIYDFYILLRRVHIRPNYSSQKSIKIEKKLYLYKASWECQLSYNLYLAQHVLNYINVISVLRVAHDAPSQ